MTTVFCKSRTMTHSYKSSTSDQGGNAFIRGDAQLDLRDAWWMGREQTDLGFYWQECLARPKLQPGGVGLVPLAFPASTRLMVICGP